MALVPTTKADLADKHWLDAKVSTLKDGIEAARDIYANWDTGRNVSRLVDTKDYGKYIAEQLGHALTLAEAIKAMPGASTRAVAAVAGVSNATVSRAKSSVTSVTVAAPVKGRDGRTTHPATKRIAAQVAAAAPPKPVAVTTTPVVQPENLHAFDVTFQKLVARFVSDVDALTGHWSLTAANKAAVKAFTDEVEVAAGKLTLT